LLAVCGINFAGFEVRAVRDTQAVRDRVGAGWRSMHADVDLTRDL